MTRSDDTILEFLLNDPNEKLRATPSVIEMNIEYGDSTVRKRVRILEEEGLIRYYDEHRSAYEITQLGERYLRGEVDRSDLEK